MNEDRIVYKIMLYNNNNATCMRRIMNHFCFRSVSLKRLQALGVPGPSPVTTTNRRDLSFRHATQREPTLFNNANNKKAYTINDTTNNVTCLKSNCIYGKIKSTNEGNIFKSYLPSRRNYYTYSHEPFHPLKRVPKWLNADEAVSVIKSGKRV